MAAAPTYWLIAVAMIFAQPPQTLAATVGFQPRIETKDEAKLVTVALLKGEDHQGFEFNTSVEIRETKCPSPCTEKKVCKFNDPVTGAELEHDLCGNSCPSPMPDKINSCEVKDYKVPKKQCFTCEQCAPIGKTCSKHTDCCISYTRSIKSVGSLPVILFGHCHNSKCVACLKDKYPCVEKSRLKCCNSKEKGGNGELSCRRGAFFFVFYPQIWPICAPDPCDDALMKKYELRQPRCNSVGNADTNPYYLGHNQCKCESGKMHYCKNKKCASCKVDAKIDAMKCTKTAECCPKHTCKDGKCKRNADYCQPLGGECKRSGDGKLHGYKCCKGSFCTLPSDNGGPDGHGICRLDGDCAVMEGECGDRSHCCADIKNAYCKSREKDDFQGLPPKFCASAAPQPDYGGETIEEQLQARNSRSFNETQADDYDNYY